MGSRSSVKVLGTDNIKESSKVRSMFASIAGHYDLANTVLSGGAHFLWRRALLQMVRSNSAGCALDLCTGTADLVPPLASHFKRVVAVDFCFPMLKLGVKKCISRNASHAALLQGDALRLPFKDNSFDLITVAFGIRNFENLHNGLMEIRRVLKPAGQLLVLEFGQPQFKPWRYIFRLYSKYCIPLIGYLLTGNREAYSYLPQTSETFPCGNALLSIFEACGFKPGGFRSLSGGIGYLYYITGPN
ncbi:MAG: ubiquinone/menaquinone biosynthesis methyltransferase [Candidatus Dadabacteria bacterium]|nr:MAG: ubiquinone/menaquinone biosynthesis methyltransferase [Candidatus Dadabacteria bacterium]